MVFKNSGMKIAPEGRARREAPRRRGEAPQTPIPEGEGKTIAVIIYITFKPPLTLTFLTRARTRARREAP